MEAAWSFNMVVHMCMRGPKRRPKAAKRLARHRPEVTPDERFVRWLFDISFGYPVCLCLGGWSLDSRSIL